MIGIDDPRAVVTPAHFGRPAVVLAGGEELPMSIIFVTLLLIFSE